MRSMSKRMSMDSPPELPKASQSDELQLKIMTVTPMMGGGAEAGVIDRERPVRAPSVRGHLRWWWRLLYGGDNVADMRGRESAIWGSTDRAGAVSISVEASPLPDRAVPKYEQYDERGKLVPFGRFGRFSNEMYALFPIANAADEGMKYIIDEDALSFTLTLRFNNLSEEQLKQVRMSVTAWIYFGGIGARTRRGLGSLKCDSSELPSFDAVRRELKGRGVSIFTKNTGGDAMAAWSKSLEVYKNYRQQRNPGSGSRPGRSHWPEPDSLRELTGRTHHPQHGTPITPSQIPSFPRAALGLPIIFQFPKDCKLGDPYEQNLTCKWKGKPYDRMSSPVITKPLYNGSKWCSAFIILPHKHALELTPVLGTQRDGKIWPMKDARYVKEYNPTHGADNAIDGFIAYAGQNSFQELN